MKQYFNIIEVKWEYAVILLNIVLCEILPKTMHPFKMLSFLMEIIFNNSCREVLLVSEVY